jgi:hypothetical protein
VYAVCVAATCNNFFVVEFGVYAAASRQKIKEIMTKSNELPSH